MNRKPNYRRLRAELIHRGTNLRRFAQEKGYPLATVYDAARGRRAGIESIRILNEINALISSPPNSRPHSTHEQTPETASVLS